MAAGSSKRVWSWVVVAALAASAAGLDAQQAGAGAPVGAVPTDRYGPPVCSVGAKAPAKSGAVERAQGEQKDAADNSRILLSQEPLENFGVERYKLVEYGECTGDHGCYWADLDAQYRRAETELKQEIASKKAGEKLAGEKLAIVMDIDETTLTNWCEMRREDFGYIAPMYSAWEASPEAAMAIPGSLRLFKQAREAGVAVFFITGRPGIPDYSTPTPAADETDATARNLEAAGFHGWEGLQLRNGGERTMSTIDYKSEERRRIVLKGYRIVLSIGDQWSDLLGEPQADVSVKLPNPFYFIP